MRNSRVSALLALASLTVCAAEAAELFWDGTAANIAANGDGASTYVSGTWSTAISNWDATTGNPHALWNNGDSAVFGGTYATGGGNRIATIGSNVTVNQIKIMIGGAGSNSRYDIGASATQNDFAITFGGTYDNDNPAISGNSGTNGFINNNFNAKITGDLSASGGLVIKHGSNITTPGSSGRFNLTNTNSNFTGDVVLAGGNLALGSAMGAAGNKVVLRGGALFISGGAAGTTTLSRNIDVAAASGLGTNAATAGLQVMDLTGTITGSANLTRYASTGGSATSEVRLSGDMSGFTGLYEGTGTAATITTIQTTAMSGGSWKLSGSATLKLNTADNTHIGDGPGKSDLLMNGGTLDLNGKNETINGLNGATGFVQNQLVATASTLTLGAGDATASFGGTIRDSSSGLLGTLALTKIGTGTQTLGGNGTYSGATTIEGGGLVLGGMFENTAITAKTGTALTIAAAGRNLKSLALEGGTTFTAPLDTGINYLLVDEALTFSGGTVTLKPSFTEAPALGTYDFIVPTGGVTGSATLVTDFSSGGSRVSGSAQVTDNIVKVTINSVGASLVWNNNAATGIWDLNGNANFLNGASNDVFKQLDTVSFGPASPAGTITLNGSLTPASVTVDSSNNFVFSGAGSLGGAASLTKTGSGTLTIANTNTFTGDTTVSGGTLAVTGALGATEMLIESGATLTGTGTIGGAVEIQGTLAPGAGVGTLSVGAGPVLLLGTYACDLDGATVDKLAVTGSLDITDATLNLNVLSAPTASYYLIATYTGTLTGTFASVPEGYLLDTSEAGKVALRIVTPPPAGTITFETDQGYPEAGQIAGTSTDPNGTAFSGSEGWSLGGAPANAHVVASSGEYLGGQAIGCANAGTYTGGRLGGIQYTGTRTLTFDCPFVSGGTAVGFMADTDHDGLFDTGHPSGGVPGSGLSFGIGGTPARFQYREAGFGTEHTSGLTGITNHWYRWNITIGDSVAGSRSITVALRNLTNGTDFDFNTATPEIDNWTFSVTDAQFGTAPEQADGLWVRATAGSRIDNIRATSVEPPPGTAYDTWMDGFPTLSGADRLPDADPDHDGTANLLEFALDGNPTTSDTDKLPAAAIVGGNYQFTFKRRDDSEGLVKLTFQYGAGVTPWTDVVISAGNGSSTPVSWVVDEQAGAADVITVSVPVTGMPKMFARLLVEEMP